MPGVLGDIQLHRPIPLPLLHSNPREQRTSHVSAHFTEQFLGHAISVWAVSTCECRTTLLVISILFYFLCFQEAQKQGKGYCDKESSLDKRW